jgi:tetratricopeptide (TPR) repeat protein
MRKSHVGLATLLVAVSSAAVPQLPETARQAMAEAVELVSRGELATAEMALRKLEREYPGDGELQYRLGLVLLRQGKPSEAKDRLESAIKLMPESPQAWLAVARTRLLSGNHAGALKAIEIANHLAPNEPFVWRASAMFFEQAGDYEKAARYELRWFEAQPGDKVSRLRAIEYFIRAGQADPAIELGLEAIQDEDLAVVHNLLGQAYRLKHDPAKAVDELQTAIRLDPDTPSYYIDIAQLFLDHNTPEPAQMILERASRKFPRNPEILRQTGLAHYASGDHAKALDSFLRITDLDPDSETGYAALETLLPYAEDRLPGIVTRLRGFQRRNPSNPLGAYLLALALRAQSGETTESQKLLEQVTSAEPAFWPAWFELHKKLERSGNLEGAIRVLERTVEINPEHLQAQFALARIYARLGNREKAKEARRRHHELVLTDRKATEERQKLYPRLPYTLRDDGA